MKKIKFNKYLNIVFLLALCTSCNSQKEFTPEEQQILDNAKANLVFVEGGTFIMGNETMLMASPTHEVTLDSYSINKYETTFKEYDLYTSINNLDKIAPDYRNQDDMGPNFGAIFMTWQQATDYCLWLGKQLDLPLDLPTEAQWEYAARSRGLNVAHATNSGKIEGGDKDNYGTDKEVNFFPPNPLGLYGLSGGRPEWTLDWRAAYGREPVTNPVADSIEISSEKIIRGYHTLVNSVYNRGSRKPDLWQAGIGFRCVCNKTTPVN